MCVSYTQAIGCGQTASSPAKHPIMQRVRDITAKGAPTIATVAGKAIWLPHRYDPGEDAVHFVEAPRDLHRRATFLTDEHLPSAAEPFVVRRSDAIANTAAAAPIHFIFHSAYCCSTLLARAFDRPGWAMGLKEPVILNDIVGWRRRGVPGPDMATVLDDVLTLLARPFGKGEAVVVKPSNIVNSLAAAMLTLRPEAGALLIHAPLRTYLGSVAKKGLDGRLWVRTLLLGLLDDKLVDFGFTPRDHLGHTDLQVAAVGWLAQHALFQSLVERFGPTRVRTLDSETLVRDPGSSMSALAELYRMPLDDDGLREILHGPAFTRHSKTEQAFAAEDRLAEQRAAHAVHGDEIEKVATWAEVIAGRAGIDIVPPCPLLHRSNP